jgi:hypothetical protein
VQIDESVKTKTKDFICTTVKWLSRIGRINLVYLKEKLIFNRFNKESAFRLKYLCALCFGEYLAYSDYLEANGMILYTLREYAEYQLHIIGFFNLTSLRRFTGSQLIVAARQWHTMVKDNRFKNARKRYKTFRAVAFSWLGYANMLVPEKPDVAESDKLDVYYNRMLKDRGLSMETVRQRKPEPEYFSIYLCRKLIKLLKAMQIREVGSLLICCLF